MMTRAEKLFNIRAQVQKAVSEIEHGAVFTSTLALADALSAVLEFLEEEMPEKVLPALQTEPIRPKVKK
jgi:hypothetical protein